MTPTQRTLKRLREQGYLAGITEHWNPFADIRQDLFGFVDIVALRGDESLYVQCTSRSNVSARIKKIVEHPNFPFVKAPTRRIQVWGWRKGDREPRIEEL